MLGFADNESGAAAAERVDYQVSFFRGHVYHAVEDLRRERVGTACLRFKFPVPHRGNVSPNVLQRDTVRIHGVPVPAVVLDFATTMPTCHDRSADAVKGLRFSLGVIEEAVMAWVQAAGYRQAGADFNGDPVPEVEPLLAKESPEHHVPFRKVVKEQRPTRFQDAHTFSEPSPAPLNVLAFGQTVVGSLTVLFA